MVVENGILIGCWKNFPVRLCRVALAVIVYMYNELQFVTIYINTTAQTKLSSWVLFTWVNPKSRPCASRSSTRLPPRPFPFFPLHKDAWYCHRLAWLLLLMIPSYFYHPTHLKLRWPSPLKTLVMPTQTTRNLRVTLDDKLFLQTLQQWPAPVDSSFTISGRFTLSSPWRPKCSSKCSSLSPPHTCTLHLFSTAAQIQLKTLVLA